MKICVYTCITGTYDVLKDPEVIPANIDFICFTDNPDLTSFIWKFRQIPEELQDLSQVKKQRIVKICPHRYLSDYDVSIWVDGNLDIKADLNEFIADYDLDKYHLYSRIHSIRNCVYAEAKEIILLHKDIAENIDPIVERYRHEGFPEHIGMAETNVILRRHNESDCKKFCQAWAAELLRYSHRDQMSFNYIAWKMQFPIGYLTKNYSLSKERDKYFRIRLHNK